MEKLLNFEIFNRGEYVSHNLLSCDKTYYMTYKEKSFNAYKAKLIHIKDINYYFKDIAYFHVYQVIITVCGKEQKAVRPDDIYLFETIDEYNIWKLNKEKNKNMNYEKENIPVFLSDLAKDFINYYDDFSKKREHYSNFVKKINDMALEQEFKTTDVEDGLVSMYVQHKNSNKQVYVLAGPTGNYKINGTTVDKETYDKAVDIMIQGGGAEAVINSVYDVLNEYIETKKAIDEKTKKTAEIVAKQTEIKDSIAKLQKELEDLNKELGK